MSGAATGAPPTTAPPTAGGDPNEVWLLAGEDARDLTAKLRRRAAVREGPLPPDDLHGPCRLAIAAPCARSRELAERTLRDGVRWSGTGGVWYSPQPLAWAGGRLAFVFPGVEPTFVSEATALADLGATFGLAPPTLDTSTVARHASSVVQLGLHLNRVVRSLGVAPDVVAGHSVGEWAASVVAGAVDEADARTVLSGLDLDRYDKLLPDLDYVATNGAADVVAAALAACDDVVVTHDNCPRQSVICGPPESVGRALLLLREVGVRGARLEFQSGFHSPALAPILPEVAELMAEIPFAPCRVPLWSATTAGLLPASADAVRSMLLRQLVEPVRFTTMLRAMHDDGIRAFVQVGVGSLPGFVDDTLVGRPHLAVSLLDSHRSALQQVRRAGAAMWVEGIDGLDAWATQANEPGSIRPLR